MKELCCQFQSAGEDTRERQLCLEIKAESFCNSCLFITARSRSVSERDTEHSRHADCALRCHVLWGARQSELTAKPKSWQVAAAVLGGFAVNSDFARLTGACRSSSCTNCSVCAVQRLWCTPIATLKFLSIRCQHDIGLSGEVCTVRLSAEQLCHAPPFRLLLPSTRRWKVPK